MQGLHFRAKSAYRVNVENNLRFASQCKVIGKIWTKDNSKTYVEPKLAYTAYMCLPHSPAYIWFDRVFIGSLRFSVVALLRGFNVHRTYLNFLS